MAHARQLLIEARSAIRELPDHRPGIIDLYTLAMGEIEEGASTRNKYELFMGGINALRKEPLTTGAHHETE